MRTSMCVLAMLAAGAASAQTTLGDFTFNDALFGDTLLESDGGVHSFSNWLNVNNSDPGNPGYLTGLGFNTGIANIGYLGQTTLYTIGYNTPILNAPGFDLGVVVARYTEDQIELAVSKEGSVFTGSITFGPEAARDTGVHYWYYYGGGGPFEAELFVQQVDLSDFGLAEGESIVAARVTGTPQLDLIRVAGYSAVPEPASLIALGVGAAMLFRPRRRASR